MSKLHDQRGKRAQQVIAAREHEARILELRKTGLSFEEIGRREHCSKSTAYKFFLRGLNRMAEEPAGDVKKLELSRLDEMQRVAWKGMHSDELLVSHGHVVTFDARNEDGDIVPIPLVDHDAKRQWMLVYLRCQDRRAKYQGLDAPKQLEVLTPEAVSAERERLDARIVELEAIVGQKEPAPIRALPALPPAREEQP